MTGRTVNEQSAPSGCSKQRPNYRGGRAVRNAEAFRIPVNSFLTQLRPKVHEPGRVSGFAVTSFPEKYMTKTLEDIQETKQKVV